MSDTTTRYTAFYPQGVTSAWTAETDDAAAWEYADCDVRYGAHCKCWRLVADMNLHTLQGRDVPPMSVLA